MKETVKPELWDIYNKDGLMTGKIIRRGEELISGEYHIVAHIWPRDENGLFLIQKRASHLTLLPGVWAATGGSAIAGEDSLMAAIREVSEEIGLSFSPKEMRFIKRIIRKDSFADIWVANVKTAIINNVVLSDEVDEVKWASLSDISKMRIEDQFHNYGEEYFSLFHAKDFNRGNEIER